MAKQLLSYNKRMCLKSFVWLSVKAQIFIVIYFMFTSFLYTYNKTYFIKCWDLAVKLSMINCKRFIILIFFYLCYFESWVVKLYNNFLIFLASHNYDKQVSSSTNHFLTKFVFNLKSLFICVYRIILRKFQRFLQIVRYVNVKCLQLLRKKYHDLDLLC